VIHLYNPGRDQAAQQIVSNFTTVDVGGMVRMQDTNLAAIAAIELDTVKTLAIMKRDAVLFEVIQAPNMSQDFFANMVASRLNVLVKNLSPASFDYLTNDIVNDLTFRTHLDDLSYQTIDFQEVYGVAPPPFRYQARDFPTSGEWFNGAANFIADDITNLKSLVVTLKSPAQADTLSPLLTARFSPATAALIANYPSGTDQDLQKALANELSQIIASGSLYEPGVFAGVKLSAETKKLVAQKPNDADLVRLNILLLLDAYPEIAKDRFQKHTPSRNAGVLGSYSLYAVAYKNLLADIDTVVGTEGALSDALRSVFDAETQLASDQMSADKAGNDYTQATGAYNASATKQVLMGTTNAVAKGITEVNKALGQVNVELQKLAASGGHFGRLAAITNELSAIDEIISAAASTNATADGAVASGSSLKKAAAIASVLPGILDKSVSLVQAIHKPPLMALLIDRDILLVQKDMAQRAIDRQTRAVTLRQQAFQALLSEANLLKEILRTKDSIQVEYNDALKTTPTLKNPLSLSTVEALGAATQDSWRASLQEALLKYAETIRVSQYHAMVAQYGLTQLTYEQANDSREGAALMWNSLIADPINELAQYHAGGIKPETIADILSKFFIGSAILAK
jgi:hypothetical protein